MNKNTSILVDFLNARLSETQVPVRGVSFLASPFFQMLLRGDAKLPLDRVEEVATALGCDDRQLFRLAMRQFYDEEAACLLEKMLAEPKFKVPERSAS